MRTRSTKLDLLCALVALVVSLLATANGARGQACYFIEPSGAWRWDSSWDPLKPSQMDDAYIGHTSYVSTARATISSTYEECYELFLGWGSADDGTVVMSFQAADLFVYGDQHIGYAGTGRMVHEAGLCQVGEDMILGDLSTGVGTVEMQTSEALLGIGERLIVGLEGEGSFHQANGVCQVNGYLELGFEEGSSGSYVLSGGTLAVYLEVLVGMGGAGSFEQTGGTLTTENVYVGYPYGEDPGAGGSYMLAGGELQVGNLAVGGPGSSTFVQTGGSCTVSSSYEGSGLVWVGGGSGRGLYEFRAGTFSGEKLFVGGTSGGTVRQFGGGSSVWEMTVGAIPGWGLYELHGGTLDSNELTLASDTDCAGTFVQTGGTNTVAGDVMIAVRDTSEGTYELRGGTLAVAGQIRRGEGTSRLHVDGGTLDVAGTIDVGYFEVGYATGSTGSFAVEEGKSLLTDTTCVGRGGTGTLSVLGYHSVAGALTVGYDGPGHTARYRLYESGMLSAGTVYVGYDGSDASFAWYGGALEVGIFSVYPSGTLQMGFDFALDELLDGSLFHGGAGSLNGLNSATLCLSNAAKATQDETATLGHLVLGSLTSPGSYELSAGALSVGDVAVGGSSSDNELHVCGTGVATIAGELAIRAGRVRVSGTSAIDAGSIVSDDRLDVEGGTVSAPTFAAGSGAETTVSGGNLWVANVTNTGQFTLTGGEVSGPSGSSRGGFENRGTLTLSGGVFDDDLSNYGTFVYEGGSFTGEWVHYGGVFSQSANLAVAEDVTNHGTMGLGAGYDLTANGAGGVTNYGSLQLAGGSLGGSAVTNEHGGLLGGAGTVAAEWTNRGSIEPDGRFVLAADGDNAGTITVGAGDELSVGGSTGLDNDGLIVVAGGLLSGSRDVHNQLNGLVEMTGAGAATATIVNDGLLHVHDGTNVSISAISGNTGELLVADARAYVGSINGMVGTMTVERATLTVGSLSANAGRTFVRDGALHFGTMSNQVGLLDVDDGLVSFGSAWGNYGTTVLTGGAQLVGAACTNSGTLSGSGTVGCAVTNQGEVRAESGTLLLAVGGSTNEAAGRIEATAGGNVTFAQGLAVNDGQIVLSGGSVSNGSFALANHGSITGHGTLRTGGLTNDGYVGAGHGDLEIIGDVTNDGTVYVEAGDTAIFYGDVSGSGSFTGAGTSKFLGAVKPGSSPGILTFEGHVELAGPSTFEVELAEPDNSDPLNPRYDALDVAGNVSLAGSLSLEWLPRAGDANSMFGGVYTILAYNGARTGAFDGVDSPLAAYLDTSEFAGGIEYDDAAGLIKVHLYDLLVGDADLDGLVGRSDLLDLRTGHDTGQGGWDLGDFDFDGAVDADDYLLWKANVGSSVPGAVPEPATVVMLLIGGAFALTRKRFHKQGRTS